MPWRENKLPVTNSKLTTLYIRVKTKKLSDSASWRENKKNFCLVGFDRLSLTIVELQVLRTHESNLSIYYYCQTERSRSPYEKQKSHSSRLRQAQLDNGGITNIKILGFSLINVW